MDTIKYSIPILLVIVAFVIISVFVHQPSAKVEGFQTLSIPLSLSTCPRWTNTIQTARGFTDCCEGELLDGKCSASTFCTLSPSHDGIPTCIDAWRQYFQKQGKQVCPSSMPHYFEDTTVKHGRKGCSSSPVRKDGISPTNPNASKCTVYISSASNKELADSCFNEQRRLQVQCPALPNYTSRVLKATTNGKLSYFYCSYQSPMGLTSRCNDDGTYSSFLDQTNPNWKTANQETFSNTFCSNIQDVERKKDLVRQQLEQEIQQKQAAQRERDQYKKESESLRVRLQNLTRKFTNASPS
jgi:hypothetical protein